MEVVSAPDDIGDVVTGVARSNRPMAGTYPLCPLLDIAAAKPGGALCGAKGSVRVLRLNGIHTGRVLA